MHGITINGDGETEKARFEKHQFIIEEHNAKGENLQLGYTRFTHMSQEEYKAAAGLGYKPSSQRHASLPNLGVHTYTGEELADSVDWTTQGAVTAVKDQGSCGSCWAFSSTGGLEGAWQVSTGQLTSMSEQYLVDCTTNAGEGGCQGGSMENAFVFVHNSGIATEASYPYTATDGSCQAGYTTAIPAGGVAGYISVD